MGNKKVEFYEASYLLAKDYVVTLGKSGKKTTFNVVGGDMVERDLKKFEDNTEIPVKDYVNAIVKLREMLRERREQNQSTKKTLSSENDDNA